MNSNRRSRLCRSCGKLISPDAPQCMHCGQKNPAKVTWFDQFIALFRFNSGVVQSVISACVILYVISLLIDPAAILNVQGFFGILAPSGKAVSILGATGSHYVVTWGRWWTLFTAVFLHGNLLHILFNMLWLSQLGSMVEDVYGHARTFILFILAGVTGFVFSTIAGIPATLGASGGIFGLFGALIFYGRHRGGHFGTALYQQVGTWAIILFVFGFMMPNVDNFAHLGGFAGGYLFASLLGYQELKRELSVHRLIAVGLAIVTGVGFVLSIVTLL